MQLAQTTQTHVRSAHAAVKVASGLAAGGRLACVDGSVRQAPRNDSPFVAHENARIKFSQNHIAETSLHYGRTPNGLAQRASVYYGRLVQTTSYLFATTVTTTVRTPHHIPRPKTDEPSAAGRFLLKHCGVPHLTNCLIDQSMTEWPFNYVLVKVNKDQGQTANSLTFQELVGKAVSQVGHAQTLIGARR